MTRQASSASARHGAGSAPAPLADLDIGKILQQMKLPNVDIPAMLESQRKDIEALFEVSQQAREGLQALANRQADMLKAAMAQFQDQVNDDAGSVAERSELAKNALGSALSHMREMAEMTVKSNEHALAILNERMQERIAQVTKGR